MYSISRNALDILTRAHGVTGRLLASVNGSSFSYPVTLEGGSVGVASKQAVRRKLTATIKADIDDPEADIFRTEMRAEYGIFSQAGEVEWIPLGTFVVSEAKKAGPGKVEISGEDRWRRVVNARFTQPEVTSGNTVAAITQLLIDADSRITVIDKTGDTTTHNSALWERDRDKAITTLAQTIGAVVYFDPMGVAIIDYEPNLASDPTVWTVAGGDGGALIGSTPGRSQGNTYNAVVVEGEGPDGKTAVRAQAQVEEPDSPLLYGGPFASRPRFFRSTLIRTTAQAQAVADSMLRKVTGVAKTLDLETFPHPGLDGGDILLAEVEEGKWERHIVDTFDVPLGPGGFSIGTRTSADTDEEAGGE